MKRLIVNADDLGLSVPITDGILESHAHGIVTSASIMANGGAFEYAAAQSKQHPRLGIGLHLSLVEEPWLTTGTPMAADYGSFAKSVYGGEIQPQQIEEELRAQLARCREHGLTLQHIDSHQHVHALPAVMRIVVRVAKEFEIPRVRVPLDSPFRTGAIGSSRFLGKTVLCLLSLQATNTVRSAGLKACDRMTGLFESGSLNEARLLRILQHLHEGTTELMCHPGKHDAKYAHWKFRWEDEWKALTSPAVRSLIQSLRIQLTQ